ncbi:MAG: leucine-rich repeat domain-containing protein [Clostridia bacterium]|nr:leucine-rich repeat domain-containing protein [Clostridia bacterium]
MKKYILKALLTTLLLVLLTYTLCSCGDKVCQGGHAGVESQSDYDSTPDTHKPLEPIMICGVEFSGAELEADLDSLPEKSYETALELVSKLPDLKKLRAKSLTLSSEEYLSLCDLNENLSIISKIDFEGEIIDLSADEIDISEHKVSDKKAFSRILSRIDKPTKLVMCDCGYTNEEMQALRDEYPTLEFAWRIYMGKWSLRTDDEAFSVMIYNYNYTRMTSEDISVLRYCTNMYALDLGHQAITDLSILEELPELRVLILADNKISDLTPISKLEKLEYLELFVNRIEDVSPLAECKNLVDLNIGWNRQIKDISSIYSLDKIERLWLPTTAAATSKQAEIISAFPDAKIIFSDVDSVSSGWRTHPRYKPMRAMFTNNKYDENFTSYKE